MAASPAAHGGLAGRPGLLGPRGVERRALPEADGLDRLENLVRNPSVPNFGFATAGEEQTNQTDAEFLARLGQQQDAEAGREHVGPGHRRVTATALATAKPGRMTSTVVAAGSSGG